MLRTKKRTLVLLLLAIAMGISLAFGVKSFGANLVAHASDAHVHCFCGSSSCSETLHDDTLVWTAWDGTSDLGTAGNYYLVDSVGSEERTKNVVVSKNVNLCLHGKTLDLGSYGLIVSEGATLTISDCAGDGVITACRNDEPTP